MSNYKNIAVIYGSDSSEWEIAVKSGRFTASKIDGSRYDVYEIFARFGKWNVVAWRPKGGERTEFPEGAQPQIDKTDFSAVIEGKKVNFEYAYIMQHGIPGESGQMQGYFEMLSIPFSSCSSFVSALTFDKFSCKNYLKDVDFVKCAKDIFIRKGESLGGLAEKAVSKLGLPLFVKPTDGGSSFGVTKVKRIEDFDAAVRFAFEDSDMVIAEEAIQGREITCAVYRDASGEQALPVIEIRTSHEYFDYDAKYNGFSEEICPAPLDSETTALVQETSRKIYAHLGCSGVVRVDYILSDSGLYVLELNTIPGMTAASLVPKMVRTAGMDMTDFLSTVIENSRRSPKRSE